MALHFIIYFVRPTYYQVLFSPPDELFKDRHDRRRYYIHQIVVAISSWSRRIVYNRKLQWLNLQVKYAGTRSIA